MKHISFGSVEKSGVVLEHLISVKANMAIAVENTGWQPETTTRDGLGEWPLIALEVPKIGVVVLTAPKLEPEAGLSVWALKENSLFDLKEAIWPIFRDDNLSAMDARTGELL